MENKDKSVDLQMELTDFMANLVKENFDIEIEMMQGEVEKMADGRTRYTLKISQEKGIPIRDFMLRVISNSNNLNLN